MRLVKSIILSVISAIMLTSCNNSSDESLETGVNQKEAQKSPSENDKPNENISGKYCYRNEYPFPDNPENKDIIELNLNIDGDKVTGNYNWLPAFKDKREGNLEGTISDRTINAKYTFNQEGQAQSADLKIELKDNQAVISGGDPALGLGANLDKNECD